MTKVADVMTKDVLTVTPDTSLRDLADILLKNNINGVPVVDEEDNLVGVVCESDLISKDKPIHIPTFFVLLDSFIPVGNPWKLEKEFKRITATTVQDILSSPAVTVEPETDLSEAARLMVEEKYYTLPVVKGGALVGVLGKADILRTMT